MHSFFGCDIHLVALLDAEGVIPGVNIAFGILAAGLLIGLTYIGGETAQIAMSLPSATTSVFQGLLLFFLLATDVLVGYRLRVGRSRSTA